MLFYPIDLLVGLQTAQLLIVALLIEMLLEFRRLGLLGLRRDRWVPFGLVELLLGPIELLVTFQMLKLLFSFEFFYLFFLACFGLFFEHFIKLIGRPPRGHRNDQREPTTKYPINLVPAACMVVPPILSKAN